MDEKDILFQSCALCMQDISNKPLYQAGAQLGFCGWRGPDNRGAAGAENSRAEVPLGTPPKFSHRICTNLRGPPDRHWGGGSGPPDPPGQLRPCYQVYGKRLSRTIQMPNHTGKTNANQAIFQPNKICQKQ
jgi:hypothetical protein